MTATDRMIREISRSIKFESPTQIVWSGVEPTGRPLGISTRISTFEAAVLVARMVLPVKRENRGNERRMKHPGQRRKKQKRWKEEEKRRGRGRR